MSRKKIFLVGDGRVGSAFADNLLQSVETDELVIYDVVKEITEGNALNPEDLAPFIGQCTAKGGDYSDAKDADIAVITTGAARKPGTTRLGLVNTNVKILESIVEPIADSGFSGIFVVSANPVGILTTSTQKLSGFPKSEAIGTGTSLDTARLRVTLSHRTGANVDHVDTYVLGERDDTSFGNFDEAVIDRKPLCSYEELDEQTLAELETDVRKKGSKIIASKGAAFYDITTYLAQIYKAILGNITRVMSLLTPMTSEYGIYDLYLGNPAVITANGIGDIIELHLSGDEKKRMTYSVMRMKGVVDGTNL